MISDAIDIGIMIYNTFWFGCQPIEPETMFQLKDAEHVAAIKWAYPDVNGYDRMKEFSHIFNNPEIKKAFAKTMLNFIHPKNPKHASGDLEHGYNACTKKHIQYLS